MGNEKSIREGNSNGNNPMFTLFVDNLPEDVSRRWVRYLFNKFSVVKDVYIPGKRSKVIGKNICFRSIRLQGLGKYGHFQREWALD